MGSNHNDQCRDDLEKLWQALTAELAAVEVRDGKSVPYADAADPMSSEQSRLYEEVIGVCRRCFPAIFAAVPALRDTPPANVRQYTERLDEIRAAVAGDLGPPYDTAA